MTVGRPTENGNSNPPCYAAYTCKCVSYRSVFPEQNFAWKSVILNYVNVECITFLVDSFRVAKTDLFAAVYSDFLQRILAWRGSYFRISHQG